MAAPAGYPISGYPHLVTDRPQGTDLAAGQVDVSQVSPSLLGALDKVAAQLGKQVSIFSGYRTDSYSASVGGFAGDPHTKGTAVDANIAGIPIGTFPSAVPLLHAAGLRSGATDFVYNGKTDPAHVDLLGATDVPGASGGGQKGLFPIDPKTGLPHVQTNVSGVGRLTGVPVVGGVVSASLDTAHFLGKLTDLNFLLRVGQVIGGAVLAFAGLILLAKQIGLSTPSVPGPSQAVAAAVG